MLKKAKVLSDSQVRKIQWMLSIAGSEERAAKVRQPRGYQHAYWRGRKKAFQEILKMLNLPDGGR